MTTQLLSLTKQIKSLSKSEEDDLWDFMKQRREDADILAEINQKLDESKNSKPLSESELKKRFKKLGIER